MRSGTRAGRAARDALSRKNDCFVALPIMPYCICGTAVAPRERSAPRGGDVLARLRLLDNRATAATMYPVTGT